MKSRNDRKREARCGGTWALAVVTGLLLVYVLITGTLTWIGVIAPLITTTAALGGVYLGSRLSQRQRREEETQRRQTLATGLLSEIRLLESGLRDIHGDPTAAYCVIEPFQTAVYDQAGANLLLFQPATVHALNLFYNGVHELRTTLARYRLQYPDLHDLAQRYPPGDQEHTHVRLMATNVHDVIEDVVTRLHKDEGGRWPGMLPPMRFRGVGSQRDVPALKPSIFEDQK
jgi:hypothetical protein